MLERPPPPVMAAPQVHQPHPVVTPASTSVTVESTWGSAEKTIQNGQTSSKAQFMQKAVATTSRATVGASGQRAKRVFKVIMIGDAGVGKTCLSFRFCNGRFPERTEATIGVDFRERSVEIDGELIKVQLWDTAGQERFRHSMTSHYYRNVHAVVFVYDISDRHSFDSLTRWIAECSAYGVTPSSDTPVILIGNKCDMVSVWDTAGLGRFRHSMTSHYYRNVHAVVFVYDISDRRSFDSLTRWIAECSAYGVTPSSDTPVILIGNKCDMVSVWDTAGLGRFRHSMTSHYYRNVHAVVFVYDISDRRSFDSLTRWIAECSAYGVTPSSDTPVILIGNKCDMVSVWDTAGLGRFRHSMTSHYYRNVHAVVFVYDISDRRSFDSLTRWIAECSAYGVTPSSDTPVILIGNKCDMVSVWDTAGLGRFRHSMTSHYYRNVHAVVFVYDISDRRSFDSLTRWIAECSAYGVMPYSDTPVILIGNKCDMVSVWDTACLGRFRHSMTSHYYRNVHAVVFVYDISDRRSFDSLTRWIAECSAYGVTPSSDTPVILIGNKCDMVSVWDTAGLGRFRHSMTSHYYRNVHAVVFVYDISDRRSFDSLTRWIAECSAYGVTPSSDTPVILIGNKCDMVSVWDTAGLGRFRHSMTSHYYRNVHAVVFVYDISDRRSFDSLTRWIAECSAYGVTPSSDTPVILVGNKYDMTDALAVSTGVAQRFADQHDMALFETSAKAAGQADHVESILMTLLHKLKDAKPMHVQTPDERQAAATAHSLAEARDGGQQAGWQSMCCA